MQALQKVKMDSVAKLIQSHHLKAFKPRNQAENEDPEKNEEAENEESAI